MNEKQFKIYEQALKDITKIRIQYPHTHQFYELVNNENLRIAKLIAASALIEADFKINSEGGYEKNRGFLQFLKVLWQRLKRKRNN